MSSPRSARAAGRGDRSRPIPIGAAAAAIALHGLLALLAARFAVPPFEPPAATAPLQLEIRATALPEPEPEPAPSTRPEPPPQTPDSRPALDREPTSEPGPPGDEETGETGPGPDDAVARPGLSARILRQIATREAGSNMPPADEPAWPERGRTVPGLPGGPGWLTPHVGRVDPSSDRWTSNDGTRRGRYVLANGTVVCTRRRAPTVDEFIHPWRYIGLTMASVCGRERADGPDFSDPRVLPPPARARRGGSGRAGTRP
jgi:hypothetical protein